MKKIILTLSVAMMSCLGLRAEGDKIEGTIQADVVSQYIWRGQDSGNMSIQPTLGIGYKGWSLSAWGSVGITDASDTKEFDLTLGYTFKNFNVGITDYWFSDGGNQSSKYFAYKAHSTNHVFEANLGYDFGFMSVQWYTNFLGNDYKANGKRAYSSYLELAAPFKLITCDWTANVGISPYASAVYGNDSFACTNVSLTCSRTIVDTKHFELPISATVAANPNSGKVYFVAGFSFIPKL